MTGELIYSGAGEDPVEQEHWEGADDIGWEGFVQYDEDEMTKLKNKIVEEAEVDTEEQRENLREIIFARLDMFMRKGYSMARLSSLNARENIRLNPNRTNHSRIHRKSKRGKTQCLSVHMNGALATSDLSARKFP
jgi:hypothetical protein